MKYIVYITHYKGDKLPPFYIGSSYEEKVLKGYNGSIRSKKWSSIYKKEQKENKHLFKTKILSYHETREEALKEELRLQKKHLVVKNKKYFNESYAQVNGFFGRCISGKDHPMYGRKHSDEQKRKWSKERKGNKLSQETKDKLSKARKGILKGPLSQEIKDKLSKAHKGNKLSQETKDKISKAHKGKIFKEETKNKLKSKAIGKNNSQFKGFCIYDKNEYISTELSEKLNVSVPLVNRMCKNNKKKITKNSYILNNFLKENYGKEVIGKTWEELGFNFKLKE